MTNGQERIFTILLQVQRLHCDAAEPAVRWMFLFPTSDKTFVQQKAFNSIINLSSIQEALQAGL